MPTLLLEVRKSGLGKRRVTSAYGARRTIFHVELSVPDGAEPD